MDRKEYFKIKNIKGQKQKAVSSYVADALNTFCEQEQEFEQAIEQSGKTFQECLDSIVEGTGNSISDLEVYAKAAKFYFSIAAVHFNMTIDLSGDNGHIDLPITMTQSKSKSSLSVSLDELLDF